MSIRLIACMTLGITFLASSTPTRGQVPPVVAELAAEVGLEVATEIGKSTIDAVYSRFTKKYQTQIESVKTTHEDPEAYLAFVKTVRVRASATDEGKVIFGESNASARLTLDLDVDVVILYPLKEIRKDASGEISLPKLDINRNVIAGYRKPNGERGTGDYKPSNLIFGIGGWSEDQKKTAAESLAYKALDAAKEHIVKESSKFEVAFKADTKKEFERLMRIRTQIEKQERASSNEGSN